MFQFMFRQSIIAANPGRHDAISLIYLPIPIRRPNINKHILCQKYNENFVNWADSLVPNCVQNIQIARVLISQAIYIAVANMFVSSLN